MIKQAAYGTEPWVLREKELDLDLLAQSESIFALSNGHIGLRGNLDEGDPHGLPGSYLNSVYEVRPLPYAEAGYGFPDAGQTVINVTNGKIFRLLVDDEPLDVRYGTVHSHERVLDLRAGTLARQLDWSSPAGARVRVSSVRMVSLTQRAIAAFSYTVEAVDAKLRLVIQSELVTNEEMPQRSGDPRLAAILESPLVSEEVGVTETPVPRAILVHRTKVSGLRVAAGMSHVITGPAKMVTHVEGRDDLARCVVAAEVAPGEKLQIIKFVGYGWSSQRSKPALVDQVGAALAAAQLTGWDGLLAEQRAYLDEFWDGADVEVDGDGEIQQAVRFGLFHILQAGARAEFRPIAAKGLTGTGYDGHTFWDTETFVLPVLTYTHPSAAGDALRWRHLILAEAKQHAIDLGLAGAAFPWRTIRGQECSGYWPAGTAAFHINADIANAVDRYLDATQDDKFEQEAGLELMVETARLWRSLGQHDAMGRFRIEGVTGPDEYSAIKDNNIYTNLMAQRNLSCAARLAEKQFRRGRSARRDHGGGRLLARRRGGDVHPVRRTPRRAPPARGLYRLRQVGLQEHPGGKLSAAAALPVLPALPQAGGQAGGPGARHVPAPGRVHPRAEGPQLRLLRAADRAGLLAVGLHPGRGRRRGRPAGPGPRLPGRGRADGPGRRGAQHLGRRTHGLAGRGVDGAGGRLRRDARGETASWPSARSCRLA